MMTSLWEITTDSKSEGIQTSIHRDIISDRILKKSKVFPKSTDCGEHLGEDIILVTCRES